MSSEEESLRAAVTSAEAELRALEAQAQASAELRRSAVALRVEHATEQVRVMLERKTRLEQEVRALEASPPGQRPEKPKRDRLAGAAALLGASLSGLWISLLLRWDGSVKLLRDEPFVQAMLTIGCVALLLSRRKGSP